MEDHNLEYVRDEKGLLKEIKVSRLDGTLVEVTRVTMFKGGSAHYWSAASGENYPVNIERAELFGGASANTFEKQ